MQRIIAQFPDTHDAIILVTEMTYRKLNESTNQSKEIGVAFGPRAAALTCSHNSETVRG